MLSKTTVGNKMLSNVKHSVCITNRKSLNFLPPDIFFCNILIFIQVMCRFLILLMMIPILVKSVLDSNTAPELPQSRLPICKSVPKRANCKICIYFSLLK